MRRRATRNLFSTFTLDSPYVTEVRRLLQNLFRVNRETGRRTYLITSAGRGEGKSTACALLGIVAAQVFRKRALIVDADFRRPTLHHLLGLSSKPGLCDILRGSASPEAAIRPTPLPTLFAIPSGHAASPIAEVYDDAVFAELLGRLRSDYDLVFIDSAPIVPVVEPLLMAEHVDGILILAMAGRTPLSLVRRMRQIIAPVENRIAGVVLNNATEGLPYYYDYRYYGYESESRGALRPRRHDPQAGSAPTEPRTPKP